MKKFLMIAVAAGMILGSVSIAQGKDFVIEVEKDKVNLRSGGSMAHRILATFEAGAKLVAVREVGDWYQVRIPKSVPVYISAKCVTMQDGNSGAVNASRVNLRCSPNTQDSILGTVDDGTRVNVREKTGEWLKIEAPDAAVGWVYKRNLKRTGFAPSEVSDSARAVEEDNTRPAAAPAKKISDADESRLGEAYRDGLTKWLAGDLKSAKEAFQQVLSDSANRGSRYEKLASDQLELISRIESRQAAMEQEKAQQRQARMDLDKEYMNKLLEMVGKFMQQKKDAKVEYTATGVFKALGMFIGRRGTHKLVSDGIETYHLRAAGKSCNLYDAKLYGKKVGIVGKIISDPSSHWKVIEVERIEAIE